MGESPHANGVHNRIGWRQRLARYQGLPVTLDLRMYDEALGEINQLGAGVRQLSDEALVARAHEIRARAMAGTRLEDLRSAFFALVREASWRAIRLRPFDVQVVAALALDGRRIVEMQTGEGKTLAAVMPVALNALRTGRSRPDLQRLPGAAGRRVDGPDLPDGGALCRLR